MEYDIKVTCSTAFYANPLLQKRIDHIRERLDRNPRTPNAYHLNQELNTLVILRDRLAKVNSQHNAKVRAQIQSLAKEA